MSNMVYVHRYCNMMMTMSFIQMKEAGMNFIKTFCVHISLSWPQTKKKTRKLNYKAREETFSASFPQDSSQVTKSVSGENFKIVWLVSVSPSQEAKAARQAHLSMTAFDTYLKMLSCLRQRMLIHWKYSGVTTIDRLLFKPFLKMKAGGKLSECRIKREKWCAEKGKSIHWKVERIIIREFLNMNELSTSSQYYFI